MAEAKKAAKVASETMARASEAWTKGFPQFEFPALEYPAAYRELAEKFTGQAKQNYDRMKVAAEEASDLIESTCATAAKGYAEYALKVLDAMRANANAHFDYAASLLTVKSPSEVVELSSAHARKSFETMSSQGKELATLAQKVSTEAAEPIKAGFNKALRVVG